MDNNLPKDQDSTQVVPPAVASGAKEVEKIATIKKELREVAKEREKKEVEPGVERIEIKEILLPEEVVKVPPDLAEMGVKPVIPPTIPEELQPKAQVVTLPSTKTEVKAGLAQPVVASVRWLYTFFDRLVRKAGGGFKYVLQSLGGKTE